MIPYQPILNYNIFGLKTDPETIPMLIAFAVFIFYVYSHIKKENIDEDILKPNEFGKFMFTILFSALAGGRIWYYFIQLKWQGWSNVIKFFNIIDIGGLTSIGMLIGGALGIFIYTLFVMKKDKKNIYSVSFARFADAAVPGVALGFFIYRLFGCFIYGDVVGKLTSVPWALFYVKTGEIRHPVALYLALSALAIFLILRLFFSYEKTAKIKFGKRFDGEVALWFLLLYCFSVFWIEFLREGRAGYLGLDIMQWVYSVGIIISIFEICVHLLIIKKLNLNLNEYANFCKKNSFLKQRKIAYKLIFQSRIQWQHEL